MSIIGVSVETATPTPMSVALREHSLREGCKAFIDRLQGLRRRESGARLVSVAARRIPG